MTDLRSEILKYTGEILDVYKTMLEKKEQRGIGVGKSRKTFNQMSKKLKKLTRIGTDLDTSKFLAKTAKELSLLSNKKDPAKNKKWRLWDPFISKIQNMLSGNR